jgi:hypothetical protein
MIRPKSHGMNRVLTKPRLKSGLIFLMHQVISTGGVFVFASILSTTVFEILGQIGLPVQMRFVHWILTETPYFPVQIGLGFFWGWLLGIRFRHRSKVWVWVVPGLLLSYVVVAVRTITPDLTSVPGQSANPFSHYFGWGCPLLDHSVPPVWVYGGMVVAEEFSRLRN